MTQIYRFVSLLLTLALAAPLHGQLPERLSFAEWAALSAKLSEPSGFFDTDNLVSNEDSYLHAVTGFTKHRVTGGVYVGVGPDQNFSYIAALKPRMAFIVDIRRDNLLEHVLFKILLDWAPTRVDYLCLLFGKPQPDTTGWGARDLSEILDYVTRAPLDTGARERARNLVRVSAMASFIPLTPKDRETITRFHDTFISSGQGLKLTSFGRPERADYPDYRRLLLEKDLDGRQANYLARESDFQFVRGLSTRSLIVPVVGDFAGPHALAAIGDYVKERGARVSAFYTSNVEEYLFRGTSFEQFTRNVSRLPHDSASVMVRSYFPYQRGHAQRRPGYLSVQLLQRLEAFLDVSRQGGYRGYLDLVTRDYL